MFHSVKDSQWLNGEVQLTITDLKQTILELIRPPYTNRKIVYISAAIIVVFLLLITALVFTIHNSIKRSTLPSKTATQTSNAKPSAAPVNPFSEGSRYQMPTYSIAYPQGSQNTTDNFPGGTTLIIQPPGYPGEPVFDVEAYSSKQNVVQKAELYDITGVKISTLKVSNMKLSELSNTYNMRTINSKPIHTPTQLRIAYLIKPNSLYVFRMYYSSSTTVQEDETLFTQFIQSFALN